MRLIGVEPTGRKPSDLNLVHANNMKIALKPVEACKRHRKTALIQASSIGLCLITSLLSGPAASLEPPAYVHQCTRDQETTRIEVVPERPKGELPCQVIVTPGSGAADVLWRIEFERGQCATKADRKRNLMEADGWRCEATVHASWIETSGPAATTDQPPSSTKSDADVEKTPGQVIDERQSFNLEALLRETDRGQTITLQLEEAVSLALRNNRDIQSGYLSREREMMSLDVAEDQFMPDLTIDAGPSWSDGAGITGEVSSAISTQLPTGGNISLSWANALTNDAGTTTLSSELSQPLLSGAGLDVNLAGLRQARLDFDAGRLNLRNAIGGTITIVILAHRSLNLAQIEIDVAERALQRAKEQKDVNQKLFAAGRIARFDLVQNDAEIARLEVNLSSTQLNLDNARRNLLELLDLETRATVIAGDSTTDRDIEVTVESALEIAYAHRADFLGAQLSDQAIKLGLEVAKSEERWGLDAVVGADYQSGLYRSGIEDDTGYRAGLRLNIPFGDVARQQSVRQARLSIEQNELSLIELTQSIETEIVNVIANIETLKKQIALAERAEKLAGDQLSVERLKFSRGLSSTLDVINLEDALLEAQRATFGAKVGYSNALTELDQALGTTTASWGIELAEKVR